MRSTRKRRGNTHRRPPCRRSAPTALDRLAAKCPEGRDEIGESAGATRELLREEGLHVFARTILVSADEFFKDEDTAAKYDMTFGDLARTVVGRMLSGD